MQIEINSARIKLTVNFGENGMYGYVFSFFITMTQNVQKNLTQNLDAKWRCMDL